MKKHHWPKTLKQDIQVRPQLHTVMYIYWSSPLLFLLNALNLWMENLVLEECMMLVLNTFNRWLMHKISVFIKTKWYNQNLVTREKYLDKVNSVLFLFETKLVDNLSICAQLVVLHESEHYLAVNKHHDLIFNTDPPDTR